MATMTRVEINEAKRKEISQHVDRLLGIGWTTRSLAAFMGVSRSAVGAWRNGRSMGTNGQRSVLRSLGAASLERDRIDVKIGLLLVNAETFVRNAELAGHESTKDYWNASAAKLRARIAELREAFPESATA